MSEIGRLRQVGQQPIRIIGVTQDTVRPARVEFAQINFDDIVPATTNTIGGIIVGDDLSITPQGRLSVIKANRAEQDNTHPITSAAVYTEIGNIDALLSTI